MKFFLIVISFVLVACNGQKKAVMGEQAVANSESAGRLELIMQEDQGGFEGDEMLVIRDAKRLKSFFSKINRTRKPGIPVPTIDFKKETLVVLCSGEHQNTLNSALELILETDKEIQLKTIYNKEKIKGKAIVSPFKIYKIPFSDKEITFKE